MIPFGYKKAGSDPQDGNPRATLFEQRVLRLFRSLPDNAECVALTADVPPFGRAVRGCVPPSTPAALPPCAPALLTRFPRATLPFTPFEYYSHAFGLSIEKARVFCSVFLQFKQDASFAKKSLFWPDHAIQLSPKRLHSFGFGGAQFVLTAEDPFCHRPPRQWARMSCGLLQQVEVVDSLLARMA